MVECLRPGATQDWGGYAGPAMTTVSSGVTFAVSSGQSDNGDVVLSGGRLNISSGGAGIGTIVSGGGVEYVYAGGVDSSGTLLISSNSFLLYYSYESVLSGGLAVGPHASSSTQYGDAGGSARRGGGVGHRGKQCLTGGWARGARAAADADPA